MPQIFIIIMTRLPALLALIALFLSLCLFPYELSAQHFRIKDSQHIQTEEWDYLFTFPEHPGLSRPVPDEVKDSTFSES